MSGRAAEHVSTIAVVALVAFGIAIVVWWYAVHTSMAVTAALGN